MIEDSPQRTAGPGELFSDKSLAEAYPDSDERDNVPATPYMSPHRIDMASYYKGKAEAFRSAADSFAALHHDILAAGYQKMADESYQDFLRECAAMKVRP